MLYVWASSNLSNMVVDSGNYGPRRFYLPLDVEDAILGKLENMLFLTMLNEKIPCR